MNTNIWEHSLDVNKLCKQMVVNNHLQIGTNRGHILVTVHFNLSPYECEHMDKNSRGVSS